ncbi:MAG: hypothetical protein U9O18_01130 [Chloroflexota bacterium]|nr:hypothetical protein [Chloroflexota bacterium]
MHMIQQVSLRRSPVAGRRSPLAEALKSDLALAMMLRDLDVALVFAFLDLPRKLAGALPEDLLPEIDEPTISRLRSRRAYLLIDHSAEAPPHIVAFSELLHAWCALRGVPPSALIYVTANPAYLGQYSEWCDAQGLDDRYTHLDFNAFTYEVSIATAGLDWARIEPSLMHQDPRPHRFLCFNNAPRPERILVVAHMLSVSPPDALVSLGSSKGRATPERSLQQIANRYETGRLLERHPALFEKLDFKTLQSRTTLEPPDPTGAVTLYRRFDLEHYAHSYVSVVTESEMKGDAVRRVTEKVLKPFLFGHLAVVAGNLGALGIVRDMGFGTFDPLIDESYDEILDPNERLCAVLCEIDRLRDLDPRAMRDLFMDLEEVRRANLHYGREVLPHRLKVDAQAALARHILDGARVIV